MKELKVEDELLKTNRRLDAIQKQLDLLTADRDILETIQGRLTSLEEQWRLTREHNHAETKNIKEEIGIANDKIVAKVETKIEGIKGLVRSRGRDTKKPWWKWGRG